MPKFLSTALALLAATAHAQPAPQTPDWPCAQRLVITLSPGTYWSGPIAANAAWRDDENLFPLVTAVIDRDTPDADAATRVAAYATTIPAAQRPALFAALTDQTNDQRSLLIARLEQLGRRQRRMGETIANLSNKLDTLPDADPTRETLAGERDFDVRAFQETQHVMRYACEAPANMERRLGTLARLLQRK